MWRTDFVHGQFAVAVLVEFPKRGWSVCNFFGRDFAVVICIECFDERGPWSGTSRVSIGATLRAPGLGAALVLRVAAGRAFILRTPGVATGCSRTRAKLTAFARAARIPPGGTGTGASSARTTLLGFELSLRVAARSAGRRSGRLVSVRANLRSGAGTAGATADRHGEKLVHGEFAVAILVEFLEHGWSVCDLFGGNLAVAIRIKRGDDRRNHGPEALGTAGSALRGLAGAGFAIVAALGLERARICLVAGRSVFGTFILSAFARGRRGIRGLCRGEVRWDCECEREEECVAFHDAGVLPGCLRIGSVHTISLPREC